MWRAGEGESGQSLAWSPAGSLCAENVRMGVGDKSLLVWQLLVVNLPYWVEEESPWQSNDLMMMMLCDVSRETDTGGKMCPEGSIIESWQDGASSRHSLKSSMSVNIIHFVCFVLKHINKSAIKPHVMNQINIIISAQIVGLCHSAEGRS